jgi:hypothetical protein
MVTSDPRSELPSLQMVPPLVGEAVPVGPDTVPEDRLPRH